MSYLAEIWKSFRATVRGFDTPHQLALGITLGVMVGLLPKDSLLPYVIGAIAILTPGNLICLAVGCLIGSIASPWMDPLTHQIGSSILTFEPLQPLLASLYQLPMIPWARLENTVVTGNLALGIITAVPVYFVSRRCVAMMGPKLYRWLMRLWPSGDTTTSELAPQLQES
ncbi:MAG: TIGR03546 family protein [Planctomycetota bacterium]